MKKATGFLGVLVGLAAIISSFQATAAPPRSTSTAGMRFCKKNESPYIIVNGARVQVCRNNYDLSKGEVGAIAGIVAAANGNSEAAIAKCEASSQAARRKFEADMPSVIEKITELSEGLYKNDHSNLIINETKDGKGKWDRIQEIKSLDGPINAKVKIYFKYYENNSPANVANNGVIKSYQISSRINIKKNKNARYLSRLIYDYNSSKDNSWKDGIEPFPSYSYQSDIGPCNNYFEVDLSRVLFNFEINIYADGKIGINRVYGLPIDNNQAVLVLETYVVNKDPYRSLFSNPLNCPETTLFESRECKIGWYISTSKLTPPPASTSQPKLHYSGKSYLGISITPVSEDLANALGLEKNRGEFVARVVPGEGADRAGLKEGDIILRVNDRPVTPETTVSSIVASITPGTQIPLYILRYGKPLNLTATVGKRPPEEQLTQSNSNSEEKKGSDKQIDTSDNKVIRDTLGLSVVTLDTQIASTLGITTDIQGVVVDVPGTGTAGQIGLRRGDVIVSTNYKSVTTVADFAAAIEEAQAAGRNAILLGVRRGGAASQYVTVRLAD